jgi:hypothetical protein
MAGRVPQCRGMIYSGTNSGVGVSSHGSGTWDARTATQGGQAMTETRYTPTLKRKGTKQLSEQYVTEAAPSLKTRP